MSKVVTFEQAKKIKELGFNNLVTSYYHNDGSFYTDIPLDHNTLVRYNNERYSAPTVSEALDFIREERGIPCAVDLVDITDRFGELRYNEYGGVYIRQDNKNIVLDPVNTYSEAENELLSALLEYLNKGGDHV